MRAGVRCGGRTVPCRSWDWDGRLGRASLGTSEWLPLPIGAGRLGTDSLEPPALLAASCPEMSEPMAGSGHDSRDQRTPTNQPAPTPRRAVLLSLSNDAGRLGWQAGSCDLDDNKVLYSVRRRCTRNRRLGTGWVAAAPRQFVHSPGVDGAEGEAGRQRGAIRRRGRAQQQALDTVARWVSTEQAPGPPPMRWNRQAGGRPIRATE